MEAVLAFVPEEERVHYSAMTGQSLFYMGETDLKHKILAIAEEEGAERASYALKLLQSEGELTIASTGKDPATGRLVTHEYRVEGPVVIFLTTTAIDLDEELLNRCLVLTVDEDREQTRAIHRAAARAPDPRGPAGAAATARRIVTLHRNAQRLLRPLLVANPYAERLTFLDDKTRTRRDHVKYLTLIRTIALLHQHQRPVKTTQPRRPDASSTSRSTPGGHRGGQPPGPRGAGPDAWTSCRRRRGACSTCCTRWSPSAAQSLEMDRQDYRFTPARGARAHRLERPR